MRLLPVCPPMRACLLLLLPGLSWGLGCSTMRPEASPQIKTFASVGDRPYPVVTGPAGDAVASGRVAPERRADTEGLVSGRVVDAQGEPVAGARVRLAADGAERGSLGSVETDRAGGFTIRGLRPGSTYTVIAELDEGESALASRVRVEAPDDQVRIALPAEGPEYGPTYAGPRRNVGRVSNPRTRPGRGDEPPLRINSADVEPPPAPEAGALRQEEDADERARELDPAPYRGRPNSRPGPSSPWRPSDGGARGDDDEVVGMATDEPRPLPRRGAVARPMSNFADEEEDDPLPPAIERPSPRGGAQALLPQPSARVPDDPVDDTTNAAPRRAPPVLDFNFGERGTSGSARRPEVERSAPATPIDVGPSERPAASEPTLPESPSPSPSPPAVAPLPEVVAPDDGSSSSSPAPAPAPEGVLPEMTSVPSEPASPPAVPEAPATAPESPDPGTPPTILEGSNLAPEQTSKRKVTWGELAAQTKEKDQRQVASQAPPTRRASAVPPLALNNKARQAKSTARAIPEKPATSADAVACSYDPVENRIVDFQLRDVAGREVRFQDLDADLILLDFWGTWCAPCRDTIPHLVELQKTYGPKRLRVVGIAYEQVPAARRADLVNETGRKLNVNYPLLLGESDGPCPLRDALHIQFYPTTVLLDRQGRVLWRQEGNTPQTMARLDRRIEVALQDAQRGGAVRR